MGIHRAFNGVSLRVRACFAVGSLLIAIVFAPACRSADADSRRVGPTTSAASAPAVEWKPIFRGIELTDITAGTPRPMRIHAVRIDLREPSIRFTIPEPRNPSTSTVPPANEVLGMKTSTFLERADCQVAINAAPFEPVVDKEGMPQTVRGLALREGRVYAEPEKPNGVLMLTKDNRATLTSPPIDTTGQYTGVGGFQMLVTEGRNLGNNSDLHPRTAVGLSQDGRLLILLAIDGRQPAYSEGATTFDTAAWLIRLGAWTGLNLDGGGSTAMAIRGPDGKPAMVNRPIHNNTSGSERPSPSHLGVFAAPLN